MTTTTDITTTIDISNAAVLLLSWGWTQNERTQWVAANGDTYWCIDEALTVALNAQAEVARDAGF